jgi:beta-lactamase regulating signal transducer with metallopeptidase domain
MTLALVTVAWLLTYLLHSTLLLGGGWLLTATGVVRSSVAKDTLWKVCLVGGLLTATVQAASQDRLYGRHFWLPSVVPAAQPASRAGTQPAADAAPAPVRVTAASARRSTSASVGAAPASSAMSANVAPSPYPLAPSPSVFGAPRWPVLLLLLWGAGAALLLARLAIRRRRFCRRLDGRRELTEGGLVEILESLCAVAGVRRRVRVAVSAQLSGPVAMGASEICLPERALSLLTPAEQRAVLAHELGHLVRRDPSWLALAVLVETLFFLQPLNRLARRRIQEAAEYLCDDWAVHQTGGSLTLAKCLAEVATWMQASRRAVPVSGMAENRSHLVERVQRLLDGVEPRAVRGLRLAVPVAALALATVAFAAPGVLPPCPADQPAAAPRHTAQRATPQASQGQPHAWATIRDGRLLEFSSGFASRITGQGRIGIRRGGRAIELMDDQRLTVNGRPVADDEAVAVCEMDTVRIVDEHGATVWNLEPVRLTLEQSRAEVTAAAAAEADAAASAANALGESVDTLRVKLDDLDAAELAATSREVARLGTRIGRDIRVRIEPQIAQIQQLSVRLATDLAPQLAEMGARIAADVRPVIAKALCDSSGCDSAAAAKHPTSRLHRGMDGRKRLR